MNQRILDVIAACANGLSVEEIESVIRGLEERIGIGSGASQAHVSGEYAIPRLVGDSFAGPLTIFDVGANRGQYLSLLLEVFGAREAFSIHCFEPSATTFALLLETAKGHPAVVANNCALAAKPGEATLYMNFPASGLASLTARRLDHFGLDHSLFSENVAIQTLDEYCETSGISEIHLLKIDVEGHELDVLKGASRMLAAKSIHLIQFEFGGANIDTRTYFQDYFYLLSEIGYDIYRILPDGTLYRIATYSEELEKFRTANYLAAKSG